MSGRTRNSAPNRDEPVGNPTDQANTEPANVVDPPIDLEREIDNDAMVVDNEGNNELVAGVDYDPLDIYTIDKLPDIEKQELKAVYETGLSKINLLLPDRMTVLKQWAEEEVDYLWDTQSIKELKNPPFTQLLDQLLVLSESVTRDSFMFPMYTFHKTVVTYGRTQDVAEKIFFCECFEKRLIRKLKSLKRFAEEYEKSTSLKEILIRVEQPSVLNDQECITKLLKELKFGLMNSTNATDVGRKTQSATIGTGNFLKFFDCINKNNGFTIWNILVGDKANNRNAVIKVLVRLYGEFKNGKPPNFDTFLSEFRSEPNILLDLQPQKISAIPSGKGKENSNSKEKKKHDKNANSSKHDDNQGRKRSSKDSKNLKKKAKYNYDKSTKSREKSD